MAKSVKLGVKSKRKQKTVKKKNIKKNIPTDMILYNDIKEQVYQEIPKHSAYRSGILVSRYKDAFKKKYGASSTKVPYTGKRDRRRGLRRWFEEDWRNQRGEVGYKYKNDVYRPTHRITKKTPITFNELHEKDDTLIKRSRRVKYRKGRVKSFKDV